MCNAVGDSVYVGFVVVVRVNPGVHKDGVDKLMPDDNAPLTALEAGVNDDLPFIPSAYTITGVTTFDRGVFKLEAVGKSTYFDFDFFFFRLLTSHLANPKTSNN